MARNDDGLRDVSGENDILSSSKERMNNIEQFNQDFLDILNRKPGTSLAMTDQNSAVQVNNNGSGSPKDKQHQDTGQGPAARRYRFQVDQGDSTK